MRSKANEIASLI